MTQQFEEPQSAFALDHTLVRRFIAGELDDAEQAVLAEQVSRLMPFHAELPNPLIVWLTELIGHLGSEAALIEWLDNFPGRPRIVARLFVFITLLDRFSGERAVVTALTEFRQHTPYPPGLEGYLVPDTNSETLAGLSWQIESLLAQDKLDNAVQLALDTAAMLAQIAPRVAELDHQLADLGDLVEKSRTDILEAVNSEAGAEDVDTGSAEPSLDTTHSNI